MKLEPKQTGGRRGAAFIKLHVKPTDHEINFVPRDHHSVFYINEHRMNITEKRVQSTE